MLEADYDWNDFRRLNVDNAKLREQNAKLRKLAQKSYYIITSERAALDTQGISPDDGVYTTALDKEIDKMKETMLELGIEVD